MDSTLAIFEVDTLKNDIQIDFFWFFFLKIHVHVKYVCCFKSQSIDFKIESERNYFGCKYLLMKQIRTRYI